MIKNLKSEVNKKIKVLIKELSPYVAGHGGELEFVGFDLKTGVVGVRLKGSCAHCALSPITLRFGLLKKLQAKFPEVKEVEAIE
ncbi:MAG: NifU family protein [Patescibacteria group bacterium]